MIKVKCLVVYSSEINGRFDAGYFLAIRNPTYLKIKNSKYPIKKLGEISTLITKGESPLWRGDSFLSKGITFLRGKNIKEGRIDFSDVVYISEGVHTRMKRSALNDNFLLLTMAGTLGDVAFFKKEYPESNINQDIAKIKLTNEVLYEYVVAYFQTDLAKSQVNILSNGGTRSHLNFDQIKSFDIIVPPLEIQERVVRLMDNAYTFRNQKQLKAREILQSIDNYIIEELGINLPKLREKIAYVVDSGKIRNRRIDSYYYQPEFEDIENSIKKSKYNAKEIGTVIEINSKLENINSYSEINYVDLSSIEKDIGKIESYVHLTPSEAPSRARQKLESGDLLLASLSGSLKSIAILEGNANNFICSTGFYIIKKSKNYNNYYLWALFRSPLYQYLLNREATGAIMSAVNRESLLKLRIPFPPLAVQDKIAEEVKKRLNEAIFLQRESKAELSRARETVEKLMLSAQ